MGDRYTSYSAEALRAVGERLLQAVGVPPEDAALVTDVHIDADLRGEESHGMRMMHLALERIRAGTSLPKPKITVLRDKGVVGLFDAHHSLGQVVATRAMKLAISKAREYGVGLVGVRHAESFTSAKYYPLLAAAEGMIGINWTNSKPMMPPHGGTLKKVGNNPMAVAAPAGEEFPFVLDIANTTAMEKIRQALSEEKPIPDNWALGHDGNVTTDPAIALETGTLLPFGGYKAFGIGAYTEVLTSVLCGGDLFTGKGTGFRPFDNLYRCSQLFQAINIEFFMPLDEFKARMDQMIRTIRDTPLRPGFDSVYLPGERGFRTMPKRGSSGIPTHDNVVIELRRIAAELKVPVPELG